MSAITVFIIIDEAFAKLSNGAAPIAIGGVEGRGFQVLCAPFLLLARVIGVYREFGASNTHDGGDTGQPVYPRHHLGQWLHGDRHWCGPGLHHPNHL